MRHMKMKELPNSSRPYERCMQEGAEHLTDAELLSIILRTGSKGESSLELAERILALNCPGEGILGLLHLSLPQRSEADVCERNRKGEGDSADVYRRAFPQNLEKEAVGKNHTI